MNIACWWLVQWYSRAYGPFYQGSSDSFFGTKNSQTQKQINTKVYSFLLCYFISIQCPISGENLFHFSCFLVLLFIFPLVKTFRVIYGFMCYYCYRWNLCAQTFFIVPLLAVYSTALLCKLEEYRMVFIGYLNTRVEINKKYDAKNGIR